VTLDIRLEILFEIFDHVVVVVVDFVVGNGVHEFMVASVVRY